MTPESDRIFRLLEAIDAKLDSFRQETERRLAILEERGSAERLQAMESRLGELEQFRASTKVYVGLAGGAAGLAASMALKLLGVR